MERLIRAREITSRALATLEEVLRQPSTPIVRDAAIQRFEYTFEAVWKLLKIYLLVRHGIETASPKSCFREALRIGILNEEQTEQALLMTDDRNLTSHTYIEKIAIVVYERLQTYFKILKDIVEKTV